MNNSMSLQEIAEYLHHLAEGAEDSSDGTDKKTLALLTGASIVKSVAEGRLVSPPVLCKDCKNRHTMSCCIMYPSDDFYCKYGEPK
jgi:hypothetical protein